MAAATADARSIDVDALTKLISTFTSGGGTTTTSSPKSQTTTSQTQLSSDNVLGLIQQLLGGTNGLASVAQGQANSGLYNSSVNTQLANDLISKTSTQVAAAAAPKVETQSTTGSTQVATNNAQLDPTSSLLTAGAAYIGGKILKRTGVLDTLNKGVDSAIDSIFGSSGGVASSVGDFASSLSSGVDFGSGASDLIGGSSALDSLGSSMNGVSSLFDGGGGLGSYLSAGSDLLSGDIGSAAGTAIGSFFGGPIGGAVGGFVGDNVLNPVLDFGGDVVSGIGDAVGSVVGSVICTELAAQGLLATGLLALEHEAVATHVSREAYLGYRLWATKVAAKMKSSSLLTFFFKPIGKAYAQELAFSLAPAFYSSSLLGKILRNFEPLSAVLWKGVSYGSRTSNRPA